MRFQAPVFLGFLMSFLASTYSQCTGCTCFMAVPASALGAVLTPSLMPLSQRSSQNIPYGGGGRKLAVNSPFHTTLQETSAPRANSKHSSASPHLALPAARSALIIRTWSLQERWMHWRGFFCVLLFMNHCSCHTITVIITFVDLWLIILAEEKKKQQKRGMCVQNQTSWK